ncbi:MAG: germination protein, Ger(x)C family [Firmicutes bacterium]|nr:germination protein, Ger(x)C family [Bacillota bacterium]
MSLRMTISCLGLAVCLLLSGCSSANETDEVAYIVAIGVDSLPNKQLNITYMIAIPRVLSTSGGSGDVDSRKSVATITIKAPSLAEGRSLLSSSIARSPDLSHIKVWVVGEELAKRGLGDLVSPIFRFREFRGSMYMMVVRGTAQEFLKTNHPSLEVLPSRWVEGILLSGNETSYLLPTNIHEFYNRLKSTSGAPYVVLAGINPLSGQDKPSAKPTSPERSSEYLPENIPRTGGNPASVLGTAVFKRDKLAGMLTNEETRMVAILMGKFPKGFLTIADPKMSERNVHVLLRLGKSPKINVGFENKRPVINIDVLIEGEITSIPSGINYEGLDSRKSLETQVSKAIKMQMVAMLKHTQELGTDVVNFGRYYRPAFNTYDEVASFNWNDLYPEAEINVQISTKIRRTGLMFKTMPIRG